MIDLLLRRMLPMALLGGSLLNAATAATPAAAKPDPANAAVEVPPLVYRSPFDAYRARSDVSPRPWKETNDTVGRIGGWRAYAREANEPDATTTPPATSEREAPPAPAPATPAAPASPGSSAPTPKAPGHGGHHAQP